MTYDAWKTTDPYGYEDRYTDEPEWPGLDACPDCGYLLRPDELPHMADGRCRPDAPPRPDSITERVTCVACGGTGVSAVDQISMCDVCPGTGTVLVMRYRA